MCSFQKVAVFVSKMTVSTHTAHVHQRSHQLAGLPRRYSVCRCTFQCWTQRRWRHARGCTQPTRTSGVEPEFGTQCTTARDFGRGCLVARIWLRHSRTRLHVLVDSNVCDFRLLFCRDKSTLAHCRTLTMLARMKARKQANTHLSQHLSSHRHQR